MSKAFIVALPEETGHRTEILGHPVLCCGVGKVNAALGAVELIRQGYTEIVNIGSAGSLNHALGEILPIGRVYQDIDCSPLCDYGHTAFEDDSQVLTLDPTSDFSCFTTDYFYDHRQQSKYAPHYLRMIGASSVFDMELFALAKACRQAGAGLTAYKWVSDDGDHEKWQDNCRVALERFLNLYPLI